MTVRKFLEQAWEIDREIKIIEEKIEKMKETVYYRKPITEGTGNSGGASDTMGRTIAKYIDYERQENEMKERLFDTRIKIEKIIATVPDKTQREILERRYLLCQRVESKYDKKTGERISEGIADIMNYSERRIYALCNEAIDFLEKSSVDFIEFQ